MERTRDERGNGTTGRRRTRRRGRRPGVRARIVQGAVLLALIAGVSAYISFNKSVSLSVDGGQPRSLHTFATTVGDLLRAEDIHTDNHDVVAPAPPASLANGAFVAVSYGRVLNLSVDGHPRRAWVTADTVGQALQQLGIRADGARLSRPLSTPIGLGGLSMTIWTQRHINFLVDGKAMAVDTTASTVGQALAQAGITLGPHDSVSVPLSAFPSDGETISVTQIIGSEEIKQQSIPYQTKTEPDPTQFTGTQTVVTPGQDGIAKVTYEVETINGVKQPPKEVASQVIKQPVTEVIKQGTKPYPTSVAGASNLDWAALAQCESGGNPKAVDPSGTYYGLYQFSVSTWQSLGGSGLPSDASSSEQTYRAELLYTRSGAGQWPVCGKNLYN